MIDRTITPFIAATSGIVMISVVTAFFTGGITPIYLLLWLVSVVLHQAVLGMQLIKHKELARNRARWLKAMLLRDVASTPEFEHYVGSITGISSDFITRELGMEQNIDIVRNLPPDVSTAEEELVKLEERSSVVLTAAVFIPVVFSLAHMFRYVEAPVVIIEIVTALTVIQSLALFYNKAIRLEGWREALMEFGKMREELISGGRQALTRIPNYFKNIQNLELGNDIDVADVKPSRSAIASVALIIGQLPNGERPKVIDRFIRSTESMPTKEELMEVRWKALNGRALLITTIGVAITGLFAGIASYSFPRIFEQIQVIRPTPYLSIFLFILVVPSSLIITQSWLDRGRQYRWSVIWSTVYWMVYLSVQIFVY